MRNVVLASLLSATTGALAVGGAIHYQVTQPWSFYVEVPSNPAGIPQTASCGSIPLTFVLTDVMVGSLNGSTGYAVSVLVNGTPVMCCGTTNGATGSQSEHLTSGIPIPANSTISVRGASPGAPLPVTLAGYVQ